MSQRPNKPASHTLPPVPICDTLSAHFKNAHNNDISPNDVVVLVPPHPLSVISGQKRFLNQQHIKWIAENILTTATQYSKLPVTGERLFWVSNTEEIIKQNQNIQVPVQLKKSNTNKQHWRTSNSACRHSFTSISHLPSTNPPRAPQTPKRTASLQNSHQHQRHSSSISNYRCMETLSRSAQTDF